MQKSLKNIYELHHKEQRGDGFSILEKERGEIFSLYIGSGKKVLDIGCRDGALTKYFVPGNSVVGADIDELSLDRARKNLGIETALLDLNGDWDELNGKTFDTIVAGEIIEHLYYPERVIQRVVALLSANGSFVGSVPNAFSLKNRIRLFLGNKKNTSLEDPTHINHFSLGELNHLLLQYFTKVRIIGLGRFKFLAQWFPGLFAFDLVFIADRKK